MAVLQHWSTDLHTSLNAPTAGTSTTAGQAAASSNPLVPPQSATNPTANPLPFQQANQGWFRSILSSLGIGRNATPARKTEMALLWNLCWGFAQVAVISTLVALSATRWKSKEDSSRTEWEACDRPLGVWACLWIARVVIATGMAYWDFVRVKMARRLQPNAANAVTGQPAPGVTSNTQSTPASQSNAFPQTDPENPFPQPTDQPPAVHLPYTHLYSRLTLFSSLLTLSWFLTAHILQYTSLNTCRHTSPHLWWLTFGILCIMYVMVLEVLLLGFIVLVLAPILFVFWNIFLFIIGRHPAQNPHMIKPDISKLPKSLVDRIPLVMYIPPPPSSKSPDPENKIAETPTASSPNAEHEYPPQQPELLTPPAPSKKSRFRFFKRKTKDSKDSTEGGSAGATSPSTEKEQEVWEGQYEKSEYPFVVLEGNRASCAICLMDFEEPKRKHGHASSSRPAPGEASSSSSPISNQDDAQGELRLADAGDGAQPLRLLACGHVFHQTCLDPWLVDVSGRCPVCQRPVEAKELKKRKKMNR
ncbi:hypothetical protein H1R20_g14362, partial [Candolleomyces eurysporus]